MHLGDESRRGRCRSVCLTALLVTLFVGCNDDSSSTTSPGTAGSGGVATGGAAGSGTAGSDGTSGGAAGAGGAAGSSSTGGAGGTSGGSAGSAGSGQGGSAGQSSDAGNDAGTSPMMTFFITSDTSVTGNLGGLAGADARCKRLASAVGLGSKNWQAYLSTDASDGGTLVNANGRIGGPFYNSKGVLMGQTFADLDAHGGDANLFLDEHGQKINGQWSGSPTPNQHDILTGSNADGTVMPGMTCNNWTSDSASTAAQVGHCDGLGPSMDATPPLNSWNSAHANGGCNDTAPRGGAGRLYCGLGPPN